MGFADGFPREWYKNGYVMYSGIKYKIAGRPCMDQFMVDFRNCSPKIGDYVLIFGSNQGDLLPVEEIARDIENEIKKSDEEIIKEQNLLIESQAIMAPEAFETKRKEYEIKVQKYNAERQSKLLKIDELIALSRNDVLNALKPILEEISNQKGITILLEKGSVMLNADKMDITCLLYTSPSPRD